MNVREGLEEFQGQFSSPDCVLTVNLSLLFPAAYFIN